MKRTTWLAMISVALVVAAPARSADRRIEKEITINAPRTEVWQAWTTSEGLKAFLGIESKVECKPGGMYEWYFSMAAPEGQRGGEGCRVLVVDAPELLVFSWNAPPKIPALRSAGAKTQVFLRFTEVGPKETQVQLSQLITESGPDWDQYVAYFNNAWPNVLKAQQSYFAKPERQPLPAYKPEAKFMSQSFDVDFPPGKVFDAVVKPEIAQLWMAPKYSIDLKVGGLMKSNYNPQAGPSDDTWIIREITAYDPGRMIAYKMTTAPANFPFKKAIEGTHSIFYFDALPNNRSRLRMHGYSSRNDEDTKKMAEYFEKANPGVIEKLKAVLAKQP